MLIVKANWVLLWFALQLRKVLVDQEGGSWVLEGHKARRIGNWLSKHQRTVAKLPDFSSGGGCGSFSGRNTDGRHIGCTGAVSTACVWGRGEQLQAIGSWSLTLYSESSMACLEAGVSLSKAKLSSEDSEAEVLAPIGPEKPKETVGWQRWWWYSKSICVKTKCTGGKRKQKGRQCTQKKAGTTWSANGEEKMNVEPSVKPSAAETKNMEDAGLGSLESHKGGSWLNNKGDALPADLHLRVGIRCMRLKPIKSANLCLYSSIAAAAPLETKSGTGIRKDLAQKTLESSTEHREVLSLFKSMLMLKGQAKTDKEVHVMVQEYSAKLRGRINPSSRGSFVDANVYSLLTGTQVVCITNTSDGFSVLFDTKKSIEEMVGAAMEPHLRMPPWNGSVCHMCHCNAKDPLASSEDQPHAVCW